MTSVEPDYIATNDGRYEIPIGFDRVDILLAVLGITRRQLECLAWIQEGKSATDIGGILGISGRTVECHIAKLCARLGVKTRVQAALKAREIGLLRSPHP